MTWKLVFRIAHLHPKTPGWEGMVHSRCLLLLVMQLPTLSPPEIAGLATVHVRCVIPVSSCTSYMLHHDFHLFHCKIQKLDKSKALVSTEVLVVLMGPGKGQRQFTRYMRIKRRQSRQRTSQLTNF